MPSISHWRSHWVTCAVETSSGRITTASTTVECRMAEKSSSVPAAGKSGGGVVPAGERKPTISKKRARVGWLSQARMPAARAGLPMNSRRRRASSRRI